MSPPGTTGDTSECEASRCAWHRFPHPGFVVGLDQGPAPSFLSLSSPWAVSSVSCKQSLGRVAGSPLSRPHPSWDHTKCSLQKITEILAKRPPLPVRCFSERRDPRLRPSAWPPCLESDTALAAPPSGERLSLCCPSTLAPSGAPNSCHYPSPQPREEPLILSLRSEAVGARSPGKGSSCSMFSLWLPACSTPQFSKWSGLEPFVLPETPCFTSCHGLPGAERPAPPFHLDLRAAIPMDPLHRPPAPRGAFPPGCPLSPSPRLSLEQTVAVRAPTTPTALSPPAGLQP